MSEQSIEIVWKDPPARATQSLWAERLAPLRERPGSWAMIREASPAKISGLRQRLGRTAALKEAFEFRAHRISDERAELYARFKGSAS